MNKLSAYRSVSHCLLFRSLLWPVKVIFLSKSPKKSLKKMFPFNVELPVNNSSFFDQKICYVLVFLLLWATMRPLLSQ